MYFVLGRCLLLVSYWCICSVCFFVFLCFSKNSAYKLFITLCLFIHWSFTFSIYFVNFFCFNYFSFFWIVWLFVILFFASSIFCFISKHLFFPWLYLFHLFVPFSFCLIVCCCVFVLFHFVLFTFYFYFIIYI